MRCHPPLVACWSLIVCGALGCTVDVNLFPDDADGSAETGSDGLPTESTDDSGDSSDNDTTDDSSADLPDDPSPTQQAVCMVPSGALDAALPCDLEPPSDVIAPTTAWTWTGPDGEDSVLTTPLVANLDDDNDDGFIDLCDTPEVIVAVVDLPPGKTDPWPQGHLHVIGGSDGNHSFMISTPIDASVNPALGDLDGDGVPEIVALQGTGPSSPYVISERRLVAFSASGELLWEGPHWQASRGGGAIAIADLDGDGSPEILAPEYVATADGELAWTIPNPPLAYSMPVAVDLDLDANLGGQLEVMFGASAYTADGTWLFDVPTVPQNRGSVAIANLDDDPYPELYVQHEGTHGLYEHDGSVKAVCPTADVDLTGVGGYPAAIHDLEDDGKVELLFGFQANFHALAVDGDSCSVRWSKKIDTSIGLSSGTLFDLLGDGSSEAIYADRSSVKLFSSAGELLFVGERSTRESISNPIVVDVDGDGAAEIVIASSEPLVSEGDEPIAPSPTLLVLQNSDDRFAPTRRVWNQHTYHHTNIEEGGRVPSVEAPHWQGENSFRVNSRVTSSDSCAPPMP